MKKCWAACLGDCSDKQSGEHIVTAGIFSSENIYVQGLPWCLDAPKEVGLASAVKNVLCTAHNSRLSPLDETVVQVFSALRQALDLNDVRSKMPPRHWNKKYFDIDGTKLERWCLKTLITLSVGGSLPLGANSRDAETPDENLVRVCFGIAQLQAPKGLYVSWAVGEKLEFKEEHVVISTFNDDGHLVGARFYLGGPIFMLYLKNREFNPGPLRFISKNGSVEQRPQPHYHHKVLNFQLGKYVSHSVRFHW